MYSLAGNHFLMVRVAFLAAVLSVSQVSAGVTQDSQSRTVEAEASANVSGSTPPDAMEQFSAPGFGIYIDDALADVVADNGLANGNAHAEAEIASIIQLSSVEAIGLGGVSVNRSGGMPNEGGASAAAVTELTYQFTLDAETNYEVLGLVESFGIDTETILELHRSDNFEVFRIDAVSTDSVDDSDIVTQSGQLTAGTYTLHALADAARGILGLPGAISTTAGGEFEFFFSLDVNAPGEVVNGHFTGDDGTTDIFGWTQTGPGTTQLSEVGEETVVLFESGSPASIAQDVATPAEEFLISYDYRFLDTTGNLELKLDGQSLETLVAPASVAGDLQTNWVLVDAALLLGQSDLALELIFDGPSSGLQLQLDEVSMSLAGDFDEDGDVDAADLAAWDAGFGTTVGAEHHQGDADGDGDVDGADYLLWQRQLGSTLGAVAAISSDAATAVPEPVTLLLGVVSGLLLVGTGRQMRA